MAWGCGLNSLSEESKFKSKALKVKLQNLVQSLKVLRRQELPLGMESRVE